MPGPTEIAEKLFWQVLEECAGLYWMAVQTFKEKHGIEITRQAVRQRALRQPEKLAEIEEKILDAAEAALFSNLIQKKNLPVKQRAAEFALKTKGRVRGYYEKKDESQETGDETGASVIFPDGSTWTY